MNAIAVKNITINYKDLTKTSIKRNLFKRKNKKIYTAIDNISFNVKKGDIIGIIGKNGSGKSTLLRAIAGVFKPDEGNINLNNNTISLLSIGVGFNKKLTGYENIYLSGMLLGFSEKQIKEKEKEIIEFADLGDFINKPVKTYSSGMYSKLSFSITSILETDIILIDEVLSVGDVNFKEKSYNKMKELIKDKNRTVIIVSHNINNIKELCNRVLWLHNGKIKRIGKTETVLAKYQEFMQIKK